MTTTIKSLGFIGGYCCVYDVVDLYSTIWDRGVFTEAVETVNSGGTLPAFYNHNVYGKVPIGHVASLEERDLGLWYDVEIYDSQVAREMLQAIVGRSVAHISFQFASIDEYIKDSIVHFARAEMIEVSPVVWPGIPQTTCRVLESEALGVARDDVIDSLVSDEREIKRALGRTRAVLEIYKEAKELINESAS